LILAALLLFATIWRAYLFANGATNARIYFGPDTNSDALLAGCLLAFANIPAIWVRRLAAIWPIWLIAMGGLIVFFTRLSDTPQYMVEVPLVSMLVALVVLTAPVSTLGKLLSTEPLRFIGKISYGLYLWHFPLIFFFCAKWHLSGWQLLLPIASAFVLSLISYFTVEAWARQLKSRLKRNRESLATEIRLVSIEKATVIG
jgi:peptidoglycan/LPS O-acetylase OafA/YrhL